MELAAELLEVAIELLELIAELELDLTLDEDVLTTELTTELELDLTLDELLATELEETPQPATTPNGAG